MKKKLLKSASVVALSAVMMCGTAAALSGCGGSGDYTLSVFIFCSNTDKATNAKICDDWAAEYTQKLRAAGEIGEDVEIKVDFDSRSDTASYFELLDQHFTNGEAEDIFYLSPKYVKVWSQTGKVLDLSRYISAETAENLNGIWQNSLSLYGYTTAEGYTQGEKISYQANGPQGAGLYTEDDGTQVGLYGLPKDYSNFAMAFNGKFYTEDMKDWLQTYGPATSREVKGAYGKAAENTYKGGSAENSVITYAVDVTAEQAYDGVAHKKGDPAPFISVGIPVNIKPYNFYQFANYSTAIDNGDPIALATEAWASDGYVVTMPGFPGDTFEITDTAYQNTDAPYDYTVGHTVFTYAEFGALTWATTFFCNTFNWWDATAGGSGESALLSGTAGMVMGSGTRSNVYGCGQYEGSTLYMLPWLYSNDSDYINEASNQANNPGVTLSTTNLTSIDAMRAAVASQTSENRSKLNLDGTYRTVQDYYGVNSYNFLETYGAFLEYGSTWNSNGEQCGDADSKSDNSWAWFRAGNNIFYGSGTWDAQARNDSDLDLYCEFRTMPSPVAEKYALYSHVKDAFYQEQTYAWVGQETDDAGYTVQKYWNGSTVVSDNDSSRITHVGESWLNDVGSEYLKVYSAAEIAANQTIRQDKWGARMDSVGYAVNASLMENEGTASEWKLEGAVDLVTQLCINEEAQTTLCYGGAQLPNFVEQCVAFLNYNQEGYEDGPFNQMLTPEGFADTDPADAQAVWDYYYSVVVEMDQLGAQKNSMTIKEFMADKTDWDGTGNIRYNHEYDDLKFSDEAFTADLSYRACAMKILNMQTYVRADRDLNMRMQYGLNSARDSATYTYASTWLESGITTRGGSSLAYSKQARIEAGKSIQSLVRVDFSQEATRTYMTAAVHCLLQASWVANDLQEVMDREKAQLENY